MTDEASGISSRRKAMYERTRKIAHDGHETRNPHENENARHPAGLKNCRKPTIGTEFNRRGHRHGEQHQKHQRARETCLEHFTHRHSLLHTLRGGKTLGQHDDAVGDRRNQDERKLDLPGCDPHLVEQVRRKPA